MHNQNQSQAEMPTQPLYEPLLPVYLPPHTAPIVPSPFTDPLFRRQWHLLNTGQTGGTTGVDLNVVSVWQDYTGRGVTVAVVDDGVQYVHPDLNDNYNQTIDYDAGDLDDDPAPGYPDEAHGTAVAGLIAAEANNGRGGVGVAPGAAIAGVRIDFFGTFRFPDEIIQDAVQQMVRFDVANNSWGYIPFYDDFAKPEFAANAAALRNAAEQGRGGLGTVIVFAGGNGRLYGENANYNNHQNSRYVTAVAALNHSGSHTFYSNPGANLLVSALGGEDSDGIVTTDRLGLPGYNLASDFSAASDYTDQFGGTSAAAPMVSGVAALMLEANPNLGYRDVREILAYSARQTDPRSSDWQINGALNWNGGGLHVNHNYGFGLVDAQAAVRLAETWTSQSTTANERSASASRSRLLRIRDRQDATDSVYISSNLAVEQVEVSLKLFHDSITDLQVILTSPSGTQSVLANQPFNDPFFGLSNERLNFTFSSTRHWGESAEGKWQLSVRDLYTGNTGVLTDWTLRVYGDSASKDSTYIYTNEYAKFSESSRSTLTDSTGTDTINAAAIVTSSAIDLTPGAVSRLAGKPLTLGSTTLIETAFGGDGDDIITGNSARNTLKGGRGNDSLSGLSNRDALEGGKGDDRLNGGDSDDLLVGGGGSDLLVGGDGNDTMTGGDVGAADTQPDRFLYDTGAPFTSGAIGSDTITDFLRGSDKIVLDKTTFTALRSGAGAGFRVSSDFALVGSDSAATGSTALIVYSRASGSLFYNANGSTAGLGSGARFLTFTGAPAIAASDFIVQS